LLCLSVGIEAAGDLIADLDAALDAAGSAGTRTASPAGGSGQEGGRRRTWLGS
jgi:hypothetical protein